MQYREYRIPEANPRLTWVSLERPAHILGRDAMASPTIRTPELEQLPEDLREAARTIGARLEGAGHQAWIVGGAVRDLALGLEPKDLDIATDAVPEQVESLFERTTPVGKAFGTVLVHVGVREGALSIDVEVTTFRSDGVYRDSRRPEEVTYSSSVGEDARRRDFTCNALYLGATGGAFQDPVQGLEDLRAGRLRCVGEPLRRFEEDGLRLLRLVRFEARFGLVPEAESLAGAHEARESLGPVSGERVRDELGGILNSHRAGAALRRMVSLGLCAQALAVWPRLGAPEQRGELCARALEALEEPPGLALGLALLLEPDPTRSGPPDEDLRACARAGLEALRPSRELRKRVESIWRDLDALQVLLEAESPTRADRLLLSREPSWEDVPLALMAWHGAQEGALLGPDSLERLERWRAERAALAQADLHPEPLLAAADLERAGIPRGPRWGELLRELERAQLDRRLTTADQARAWLAER